MTRVFLGLGANIGNRAANLRMALSYLERRVRIGAVSSLYRSEAVVLEDQHPGPDFYNAACEIDADLAPGELLQFVKEVEYEIGRRPGARWAPRPIDIDILLFGDEVVETDAITIPHPALHARNFVLLPLAEIAPDVEHPVLGRLIADLADDADFAGLEHVAGPEWPDGTGEASFDTDDAVRWNDVEGGA
jgi:2-amino-4-hydroxy-6-hydroxymethyldihydropteridine diphosphokinase